MQQKNASYSIAELATILGLEAAGNLEMRVTSLAEPAWAGPDDLALAFVPKYAKALEKTQARAALLWPDADWQKMGLKAAIFTTRGRYTMSKLTRLYDPGPQLQAGVHSTCIVDPTAEIAADAALGPFCIVGAGAKIGAGARLIGRVSIGENSRIGSDALLYQGVTITHNVIIGDRFIAHPGVVIGADGFSFVTPEVSSVERLRSESFTPETAQNTPSGSPQEQPQKWVRIHSLGGVLIGDDVEIGANSCVDRGTVRPTVIGARTKIDNQVQIGHNVQIGEDCLLCGQVGIAGSVQIGNRVVMGGKTGVGDNIKIGDDVVAGGGSGIASNISKGRFVVSSPAMDVDKATEVYRALRHLPGLLTKVEALEKGFAALDDNKKSTL